MPKTNRNIGVSRNKKVRKPRVQIREGITKDGAGGNIIRQEDLRDPKNVDVRNQAARNKQLIVGTQEVEVATVRNSSGSFYTTGAADGGGGGSYRSMEDDNVGTSQTDDEIMYLKSTVDVDSAYTSENLGYISLVPEHRKANDSKLTIKAGDSLSGWYKLSFDLYCLCPWQFFVSDGDNADILPGVLIYTPTSGGGSNTDTVLTSQGWVHTQEMLEGGIKPFVNAVGNGDFHDITDTGILLDEALTVGKTVVDVDGTGVSTGTCFQKIFLTEGTNVPGSNWDDTIGVCTGITDATQDKLSFTGHRNNSPEVTVDDVGSQIVANNNDKLYTLDDWELVGTTLWPTWLSTNIVRSEDSAGEDNHSKGISDLDGGRNGTSVLKLSTHHNIYTNPTSSTGGHYLYQDIELDGNCWYDLHFKYLTSAVESVDANPNYHDINGAVKASLIYSLIDKERNVPLIGDGNVDNGWVFAEDSSLNSDVATLGEGGNSGGNWLNFRFCEQNQFFTHNNQYYDHFTDTIKFNYSTFYVPPLATESSSVTVSLRFSMFIPQGHALTGTEDGNPGLKDESHSILLSYVAIKKSFPDLIHMSNGKRSMVPVRGLSRDDGIESHSNKFYDRWQKYELSFPAISPGYFANENNEVDDFEIRFYGGSFGVTKNTKAALVTQVALVSTTATYSSTAHGFSAGDKITISGTTNFNDEHLANNTVQSVATNSFTMTVSSGGAADESGLTANAELINSSSYPNKQVVGIRNVKLLSTYYKSGEEYSDHLLCLQDNRTQGGTAKTYFSLYHTNHNFWDTTFIVAPANYNPTFEYINGRLRVGDKEFYQNQPTYYWFYLDKVTENGLVFKEFITLTENQILVDHSGLMVTETKDQTYWSQYEVDALRILGHNYQGMKIWPNSSLTGFVGENDSTNTEGNSPWRYTQFYRQLDWKPDTPYQDGDGEYNSYDLWYWGFPRNENQYTQHIPIAYYPEKIGPGGSYIHYPKPSRTQHNSFRHEGGTLFSSSPVEYAWKPGGESVSGCAAGNNIQNIETCPNPLGDISGNGIKNLPIYLSIPGWGQGVNGEFYGSEGGVQITNYGEKNKNWGNALQHQLGYQLPVSDATLEVALADVDESTAVNTFPWCTYLKFRINLVGIALSRLSYWNNAAWGGDEYDEAKSIKLEDCFVPQMQVKAWLIPENWGTEMWGSHSYSTQSPFLETLGTGGGNNYCSSQQVVGSAWGPSGQRVKIKEYMSLDYWPNWNDFDNPKLPWETIAPSGCGGYTNFNIPYNFTINPDMELPDHKLFHAGRSLILKIWFSGSDLSDPYSLLNFPGYHFSWPTGMSDVSPGENSEELDCGTHVGINFSYFDVGFKDPEPAGGSGSNLFGTDVPEDMMAINFDFQSLDLEYTDSWVGRKFNIATTLTNYWGEEGKLQVFDTMVGEQYPAEPGAAPRVSIAIPVSSIANNPLIKEMKIYFKDIEQDIWYKQFTFDTQENVIKPSTSSKEFAPDIVSPSGSHYIFEIPPEDMVHFNEIDSYAKETFISQEDGLSLETMRVNYKYSVQANNRLYVGNIYNPYTEIQQGDRMIKTPIGKYNIFPSSNYIDVAILDGDEITGLAYYKDKILQFKKRKVFVINIAGDTEFLEDTFEHIGITNDCQVVTTPHGICWVNSKGCFIYNGEELTNLIDNKIGAQGFQAAGAAGTDNYWSILDTYVPAIGYVSSTKKLIIAKHTGHVPGSLTNSLDSASIEGFTYDFQSKGWTFLMNKFTGVEDATKSNKIGLLSNFANDVNGDVLYYAVGASSDNQDINSVYRWSEESITSLDSGNNEDYFYLLTKDFDFGSPGARKKIYKVYVTFKSVQKSCSVSNYADKSSCEANSGTWSEAAAHSGIKVYWGYNGRASLTEFADASVNYSTTNGLSDGASSTDWIIAELVPSVSVNNIYSFQLQFKAIAANVANGFEINDITIIYREKPIK